MWATEGKGGEKPWDLRSALGVSSTRLELLGGRRGGEGLGPTVGPPGGPAARGTGVPTPLRFHPGAHRSALGSVLEGETPWVHGLR